VIGGRRTEVIDGGGSMPANRTVLTGVVRDAAGDPVPEARVYLTAAPVPVPDIAALTDAEGQFAMALPAPGSYEVACSAEGYVPASATVEVAGEQELHLELRLTPERPGPI
jgi:hypothetical protein